MKDEKRREKDCGDLTGFHSTISTRAYVRARGLIGSRHNEPCQVLKPLTLT